MDSKEYIEKALRTATHDYESIVNRLQDHDTISLLHASIGLTTESAEFADTIKKHIYYGKEIDKINLIEEIGDLAWYCAIALNTLGSSFEQIMEKNIAKLQARYPDKFTEEKAKHRDLTLERSILENNN
jgi:NTP pyrophosphatase (non-canonical NTP hydrolase)